MVVFFVFQHHVDGSMAEGIVAAPSCSHSRFHGDHLGHRKASHTMSTHAHSDHRHPVHFGHDRLYGAVNRVLSSLENIDRHARRTHGIDHMHIVAITSAVSELRAATRAARVLIEQSMDRPQHLRRITNDLDHYAHTAATIERSVTALSSADRLVTRLTAVAPIEDIAAADDIRSLQAHADELTRSIRRLDKSLPTALRTLENTIKNAADRFAHLLA